MKKLHKEQLTYIGPLMLAVKDDLEYTEVRTGKKIAPMSDEYKNKYRKVTEAEFAERNRKSWDDIESIIDFNNGSEELVMNATRSYIPPTVYQVANESSFVRVYEGTNSNPSNPYTDSAYGGKQGWFSTESGYNHLTSCGVVSAANVTAYWAREKSSYADLYEQADLGYSKFYKSYFLGHMKEVYSDVTPSPLGIPTLWIFRNGMSDYMDRTLGYTLSSGTVSAGSYSTFVSGISTGLSYEAPISMLFLTVDTSALNPDFAAHWITITKYFRDNNIYTDYYACSSWGKRYSLGLYEYWNAYLIDGGVYYK